MPTAQDKYNRMMEYADKFHEKEKQCRIEGLVTSQKANETICLKYLRDAKVELQQIIRENQSAMKMLEKRLKEKKGDKNVEHD